MLVTHVGVPRYRQLPRALLLSSVLIISLLTSACGADPFLAAPSNLVSAGVLTVGTDASYPPQEYLDSTSHQATGFDIDLITAIAQRMGLRVHIVSDTF